MLCVERTNCRICGQELPKENVLDLGKQTIVDFLAEGEEGRGKAPLQLVACSSCTLLQLRHTVEADTLYRRFFYRSSVNEQMRLALRDVAVTVRKYVQLKEGDGILDIGVNDGEGLFHYPRSCLRVGFEPAYQLAEEAQARFPDAKIVPDYFNAEAALIVSGGKKYKACTAVAMFYDLEDPVQFVKDVVEVLEEDGLFLVQMNYLMLMLENMTFDNISHEHLGYYSFSVMKNLLEQNGLRVVQVSLNDVNGGSLRILARKGGRWPRKRAVKKLLASELGFTAERAYKQFGERVRASMMHLKAFLESLKAAEKVVYAYGASTRGSTLLQTMLGEGKAADLLMGVAERDPHKIGKKMAGLDLPIVSEQEAREKADYFLLLPYSFWRSIQEREKPWMLAGGKFILPVPLPKVVSLVAERTKTEFVLEEKPLEQGLAKAAP